MPRASDGYGDKVLRDQGTALILEKSEMTPCRRWLWNHHEDRKAIGQVYQVQKNTLDLIQAEG